MLLDSLWLVVKCAFAMFIGLCGGTLVAGGLFALLVKVGIITRMIARTKTAGMISWYEDTLIVGATLGNLYSVFDFYLPGGFVVLAFYGIFSGIFAGCLALALAEAVNTFPVMLRRIRLTGGLSWLVLAFTLGKMLGSFFQLL